MDKIDDFKIDRTETGWRVTRISDLKDCHTHLLSYQGAVNAIKYVVGHKIPKNTKNYYLRSLIRLSTAEKYITQIETLIKTREQKGKKLHYCNKRK